MSHLNKEQLDGLIDVAGIDGTREILQAFWSSTEGLLDAMRDQLHEEDYENAARTAHAIKGSSANVGASGLASGARDIENYCRNGEPIDTFEIEAMILQFEEARQAFEEHLLSRAV